MQQFVPTNPVNPYGVNLSPQMLEILRQAMEERIWFGWINALRGFYSTKWRVLAESRMTNQDTPLQPQEGHQRISTIVHRIQSFVSVRWEGRNISLHKSEQHEEARQHPRNSALFQSALSSTSDQHYCSGSLTKLLRSQPVYRRRWLRRVRQARADMLNDQRRQALITTYFTRICTAVTPAKPPGRGTV
jgi:hypothetical protein